MFATKKTARYNHPTEPGAWVEMRLPPTAAEMKGADPSQGNFGIGLSVLARCIVAWSDERPVTQEAVEELDQETFGWLMHILRTSVDERPPVEKKGLNAPSSRTSSAARRSRTSSRT